jgi:hypothetical protein
VIAHDAGGAEIVAGYVKKHASIKNFHVYVAGPALRIFRREHIAFHKIPSSNGAIAAITQRHQGATLALLGTGWMTSIERDALSAAKSFGIKTAVYLESWANYRERFGFPERGWQKQLPDEIWVGDAHAQRLAEQYFRKTKIRFEANQYFRNMVERFRILKSTAKTPFGVLFLSDALPGVNPIFKDLIAHLATLQSPPPVRIRFHPADDRRRYDAVIKRYEGSVLIKKSTAKDILHDLLSVRVVIGTETVAMVVAVLVGKKTINISPLTQRSQLPFSEIIRVRSPRDAVNLI